VIEMTEDQKISPSLWRVKDGDAWTTLQARTTSIGLGPEDREGLLLVQESGEVAEVTKPEWKGETLVVPKDALEEYFPSPQTFIVSMQFPIEIFPGVSQERRKNLARAAIIQRASQGDFECELHEQNAD